MCEYLQYNSAIIFQQECKRPHRAPTHLYRRLTLVSAAGRPGRGLRWGPPERGEDLPRGRLDRRAGAVDRRHLGVRGAWDSAVVFPTGAQLCLWMCSVSDFEWRKLSCSFKASRRTFVAGVGAAELSGSCRMDECSLGGPYRGGSPAPRYNEGYLTPQ